MDNDHVGIVGGLEVTPFMLVWLVSAVAMVKSGREVKKYRKSSEKTSVFVIE